MRFVPIVSPHARPSFEAHARSSPFRFYANKEMDVPFVGRLGGGVNDIAKLRIPSYVEGNVLRELPVDQWGFFVDYDNRPPGGTSDMLTVLEQ